MSQVIRRGSILSILLVFTLMAVSVDGMVLQGSMRHAYAAAGQTTRSVFCSQLGKTIQASAGAQMYCFGPRPNGLAKRTIAPAPSFSSNVDAADPAEDVSPTGVQAYGQAETSIAASGPYAVEAWNDVTGFLSPCGSPMNKEEFTGFGFSADAGASFTDQGGLPNSDCANTRYGGDPSVEAFQSGGKSYFYISSLFDPLSSTADSRSHLAMAACVASGRGSSARLSCSQPIIIASSSQCVVIHGSTICSFLDKEFLSIDPARGLLYASYTEFSFTSTLLPASTIELAVCDIGNGLLGGTPAAPVCTNGSSGSATSPAAPYLVVAPADLAGCENTGAYPAVDQATGGLYVAYEHNVFTAIIGCFAGPSSPVQNVMNFIPVSCLTLPAASCAGPAVVNAVNVISLQVAFIPGYNRFPMNDFPRLAVSDAHSTITMVWNDARFHPAGDILMQSMHLGTLGNVTAHPVVLNRDSGGWHFLPALRNSDQSGSLNVSWYSRASANTAITSVTAAVDVDPLAAGTPHNILVTDVSSDWNAVSSDTVPNFGDYTDNYVIRTSGGERLYVAWTDGRLGDPQPFEANTHS